MTMITSFEVLGQPIVPGVANVPFIQQGAFLQLTNISSGTATFELNYEATPAFVATSGDVVLGANYIDQNGNYTLVSAATFLAGTVGFGQVSIPTNSTFIFAVQYILQQNVPPAGPLVSGTPQSAAGTRGLITTTNGTGLQLVATATIRQVFTNFDAQGNVQDLSEAAYAVPIIGGPVITLD